MRQRETIRLTCCPPTTPSEKSLTATPRPRLRLSVPNPRVWKHRPSHAASVTPRPIVIIWPATSTLAPTVTWCTSGLTRDRTTRGGGIAFSPKFATTIELKKAALALAERTHTELTTRPNKCRVACVDYICAKRLWQAEAVSPVEATLTLRSMIKRGGLIKKKKRKKELPRAGIEPATF